MDYRDAGVDVEAGRAFVNRIRTQVENTYRPGVLGSIGGFGGYFQLPSGYREPVLVSGTDGVGTKLKLAQALQRHDSIGIDLVAMCVNDVITAGAEPLFFLDYIATGQLDGEQLAAVIEGIATGCRLSGCALLGGETAEMPGFYGVGTYDLAGFCVGIVEKSQLLDGSQVKIGDRVLGLASQGVHSNGFSLIRKIIETQKIDWQATPPQLGGQVLGEVLLTPTQIYVQPVLAALGAGLPIRAMAHITGGGLPENLPRCLAPGQSVQLEAKSWPVLPIFNWIAAAGALKSEVLWNTFNLGIGLAIVLPPSAMETALDFFAAQSVAAYAIGEVIAGTGQVLGLPE
ncbi:MAG: phosphoribosylformylglycinamidine cyclo-ligase [Chloroflexaceae bacterium]|nr:phosphoribosylformylglycinamidine cyclo-ligase [Chloroflexaceae bacterium]